MEGKDKLTFENLTQICASASHIFETPAQLLISRLQV